MRSAPLLSTTTQIDLLALVSLRLKRPRAQIVLCINCTHTNKAKNRNRFLQMAGPSSEGRRPPPPTPEWMQAGPSRTVPLQTPRRTRLDVLVPQETRKKKPDLPSLHEFRFPALLDHAELPRRQPHSARQASVKSEWSHFKKGLDTRRVASVRAVAPRLHSDEPESLPPVFSSRHRVIDMPRERVSQDILRPPVYRHRQDDVTRVIGYNFVPSEHGRSSSASHAPMPQPLPVRMRRPDDDEYIFPPDEAYAIACRGVAEARRQARKLDQSFVALLVHAPSIPAR